MAILQIKSCYYLKISHLKKNFCKNVLILEHYIRLVFIIYYK